ncbi:MAG: hypothetical protein M1314_00865 [Firmicutes bacterium]|nr:hypothetical protein [Bacillota bacterium]
MHVIVDNLKTDPWAITAGIAAVVAAFVGVFALGITILTLKQARRQTRLAENALRAAQDELALARDQLAATETATRQTQEALELGRRQLEYMQKADLDRARALAPRITAEMKLDAKGDRYVMHLSNSGAVASCSSRAVILRGNFIIPLCKNWILAKISFLPSSSFCLGRQVGAR